MRKENKEKQDLKKYLQGSVTILRDIMNVLPGELQWASSIAVRALAYSAKDPRFETHFEPRVGRSLSVHPAAKWDLVESPGR